MPIMDLLNSKRLKFLPGKLGLLKSKIDKTASIMLESMGKSLSRAGEVDFIGFDTYFSKENHHPESA